MVTYTGLAVRSWMSVKDEMHLPEQIARKFRLLEATLRLLCAATGD